MDYNDSNIYNDELVNVVFFYDASSAVPLTNSKTLFYELRMQKATWKALLPRWGGCCDNLVTESAVRVDVHSDADPRKIPPPRSLVDVHTYAYP